jgi:hypothetical protein
LLTHTLCHNNVGEGSEKAASIFNQSSRRASDVGAWAVAVVLFVDSHDFMACRFLVSPTLAW